MAKYEKGKIVKGSVTGIESYGAFVSFNDYYSGLIHISEVSRGFVRDINDFIKIGDHIFVEILDVDEDEKHLKLSIKDIDYKNDSYVKRNKIVETPSGFNTLRKKLPIWIKESLEKQKSYYSQP